MSIKCFTNNVSKHTTIALWVFATITVGLGIYSAVCPPQGVIDKTVLEFGCLMTGFATLAVAREAIREGFRNGVGIKYTHGDTTIEIDDDKDDE